MKSLHFASYWNTTRVFGTSIFPSIASIIMTESPMTITLSSISASLELLLSGTFGHYRTKLTMNSRPPSSPLFLLSMRSIWWPIPVSQNGIINFEMHFAAKASLSLLSSGDWNGTEPPATTHRTTLTSIDDSISKTSLSVSHSSLLLLPWSIFSLLDNAQQRKCPLAMKHADVWYEMAERKVPLGLIVEDDVIFVPFFKEKLTRMIHAALRTGALRLNGTCAVSKNKTIADDEWINQNPMFVIGTCYYFHGSAFEKSSPRARPVLSTHKSNPSRCTHAYLLTWCSAQALVEQIQAKQSDFWPSDFMQNHLFPASPTLQSFWVDPPLVYQGNQVTDLDNVNTFKKQTYWSRPILSRKQCRHQRRKERFMFFQM